MSTFTGTESVLWFAQTSEHEEVRFCTPCTDDVVCWAQCAESTPEPLSVQFHATDALVLIHPAAFALGVTTGASVGPDTSGAANVIVT